jgi:hypothetical protein
MTENLNFGQAIEALKDGKKVARQGWNGKGMWIEILKLYTHTPVQDGRTLQPLLTIKRVEGDYAQWQPSATDTLAEDWTIVD